MCHIFSSEKKIQIMQHNNNKMSESTGENAKYLWKLG